MDEEEREREIRNRRIRRVIGGVLLLIVIAVVFRYFTERMLTSMGLQAAPDSFFEEGPTAAEPEPEEFAHGHVAVWNGEEEDKGPALPAYEVTVEDYRLAGLSKVGRPSATQEKLSTDLFVVINDDPGELVLAAMEKAGIEPKNADTMSILVRDHPDNWQTLSVFDPVTVTVTVPDALVEEAFVDNLVAYAVYNKQYPDAPGGLAPLPVSVSEEDGICYASFLIREEYETEYALCAGTR